MQRNDPLLHHFAFLLVMGKQLITAVSGSMVSVAISVMAALALTSHSTHPTSAWTLES